MRVPDGDPSTWRCDTCNERHAVAPIAWTYVTQSTAPAEASARVRAEAAVSVTRGLEVRPGTGTTFEDDEWGVCQACHEIICDGTVGDLIDRNFQMQFGHLLLLGDADAIFEDAIKKAKVQVAAILILFWQHKEPNPVREEFG